MKKILVLLGLIMSFSSYSNETYEESTQRLFKPMLNDMKCIEMSRRKINDEVGHNIKCFAPVSYGEIEINLTVIEKGTSIAFTWTIDRNQTGDIDQYIFNVTYQENRFYNLLMIEIPKYVASLVQSKSIGDEFYPIKKPQILEEEHHYAHKFHFNYKTLIVVNKIITPYGEPSYFSKRKVNVSSTLKDNKVSIYASAQNID